MKKIIRQYNESEVYETIERVHKIDNDEDSNLLDRIEEHKYYNHVIDFDFSELDNNEWDVCDSIVDDYIKKIKENGEKSIPKIVIDKDNSIIDGIHRLNAFLKLGIKKGEIIIGSNKKIEIIKKKLIDEELKIVKYYNDFGHISVMENAKYSPAENSIAEFIVKDEYRNLGIGKDLISHIKKEYSEIGAQISSKSSLKSFAQNGFGLLNNEDKIEDINKLVFLTLEKDKTIKRDYYVDFVLKKWNENYEKIKNEFDLSGNSLFLTNMKKNSLKIEKKNDNVSKLKLR